MFKVLDLPIEKIIVKTDNFKQSSLSKKERENIYLKLKIIDGEKISNKNVLLVDDVMTTGSSVKSCIKLLSKFNPKSIKILIMSKNRRTMSNFLG